MWNDLSILDKSRIMLLAVLNGITSLSKIQLLYDSSVLKSDDYDYVGYYNKYPNDSLRHRFEEGGDTTPLDTREGQTFIQDYAYRVSKENPSITTQDVNNAISSVNFTQANRSSSGIGGTYTADNKTVYLPILNKWTPSAAHEIGGHHLRNELFGGLSAISQERQQMLEAAYPNFYVPLEEVQKNRPTEERIATNTQLRATIMQNTGLSGQALDAYIQNMSDAAILSQLYQHSNGYILGARLPFIRSSATLSNGQKANVDDYNDLQNLPQGQTSEGWFGISEEDRQKALKEYEDTFNSNFTDEDKKQAEALRWTLLNIAQNNRPQQPHIYLAAKGGPIHIAPSKRGTFTAAAKKHGKSVLAFASQVLANKDKYSLAMVKKANFARNARKWKHDDGGNLFYNPNRYDLGSLLASGTKAIKRFFGLEKDNTPIIEEIPTEEIVIEQQPNVGLDYNELRNRLAYAESRYKSNAKSPAGAIGLFQIMPSVLDDYNKKNNTRYTTTDLKNDTVNTTIRDWKMELLSKRPWVIKGDASDSIKFAKELAAYNFGSTNTVEALNKAKEEGVDIYNNWDWLDYLPKETLDYINFILRNQNNSILRNDTAYKAALALNKGTVDYLNSKSTGGPLYPFSFSKIPYIKTPIVRY